MTEEEKKYFEEITAKLENSIMTKLGVRLSELGEMTHVEKVLTYKKLTISQRKTDGRYWTRFRMYGKQYSVYGKTAEECLSNVKKRIRELKKLGPQEPTERGKTSFTTWEWLDFWRETYKHNIDVTNIEVNIRLHIKPNLKNVNMVAILPSDLQRCLNCIESTRVKKYCYDIIRDCWQRALVDGIIKTNPAIALPRVRHRRKKGAELSSEEEKMFFEAIRGQKGEKGFVFLLLTGVRRGELLTINVKNIDKVNRLIHVGGTKTVNAVRDIPLTEVTEGLLDSIEPDAEGYYFRQYGTASWWTHEIRKYVSSEHTLKDLRNTFIARASDAGIIMSATQVWAGHADIRTTGNIYNNAQRQAALRSEHARLNHFYNDYFADLFQPVEKVDTQFDTHGEE